MNPYKSRDRWRTLCIVLFLLFVLQGVIIGKRIDDVVESQQAVFSMLGDSARVTNSRIDTIIENQLEIIREYRETIREIRSDSCASWEQNGGLPKDWRTVQRVGKK